MVALIQTVYLGHVFVIKSEGENVHIVLYMVSGRRFWYHAWKENQKYLSYIAEDRVQHILCFQFLIIYTVFNTVSLSNI